MRTLTSPADIDRLFKKGRRASHPLLVVLAQRAPDGDAVEGRVVFVAGRKLGGAVVRNRSKRVLREACRRSGGPWAGSDVALVARAGTATASPADLDAAVSSAVRTLGLTGP